MEEPLCLSQSFVNKQNVRSFGNILRRNLLKCKDSAVFLRNIFRDDLVSQISPQLIFLLSVIKTNITENSKQDFRNYFPASKTVSKPLLAVDKEILATGCWSALCQIIPKEMYSSNHNLKLFRKIVNTIIFSMKGEHVLFIKFIEKWDFTVCPWNFNSKDISREILYQLLTWIARNVVSAIICLNFYVATCKLSADEYKLYFYWKNEWQAFHDKQISKMIFTNVIQRSESHCLGNKIRKRFILEERLKRKSFKRNVPKLYLILKANNEFRPIVRYKNEQLSMAEKKKIKERLFFLRKITGKTQLKIESTYNNLHQHWITLGRPKLFFVKADLTNAFGSIDREKLMKILCEKHIMFQKTEKELLLKKRFAQLYKDFISEMRRPLYVRVGSTIYEWKRGLVQGYKYSPALSEMYYNHMDEIYFSNLKNQNGRIRILTRVVDDYLFISDSLEDAHAFLNALSNYRNVNYDKTVVNFDHPTIQISSEITFLGYCYNTENLEVNRADNVFSGQMCYKIAFTNAISNISKFLENRIGQSGIHINNHIFNFQYNDEKMVWRHIFTTLCLSANKFCTILSILSDGKEMVKYLPLYKKRVVVKLCNNILETLMKNKPKDVLFLYCINHFRFLSWKALLLCARKTPKCNELVPLINNELAKSNCIFGKWREHASRINMEGVSKYAAVREVCTRTDLRMIMKSFDALPNGFQCYNNKSRFL